MARDDIIKIVIDIARAPVSSGPGATLQVHLSLICRKHNSSNYCTVLANAPKAVNIKSLNFVKNIQEILNTGVISKFFIEKVKYVVLRPSRVVFALNQKLVDI